MSNSAKALHSSENPLHEALAVSPLVITLLIVVGIFLLIAIAYINHMLESSKLEKARLKADLIDRTRRNRSVSDNLPGQLMTPALKLLLSRLQLHFSERMLPFDKGNNALKARIAAGHVQDVFPYERERRFMAHALA